MGITVLVAEAGVDAVNAVADEWVDVGVEVIGDECSDPLTEILFDLSPIGEGAGGAALMAAGIAINPDGERALTEGHFEIVILHPTQEGLEGLFGVGVGLENDFFEDVNDLADFLHE